MKVKIFEGDKLDSMEEEINKWLSTVEASNIIAIGQSECAGDKEFYSLTISVWYT